MTECVKYLDETPYGPMWRCEMRRDGVMTVMPICFENNVAIHRNGSGQTHARTQPELYARMDWIDRNVSLDYLIRYMELWDAATTTADMAAVHALLPDKEKQDRKNAKLFKQQFPDIKQYNNAYFTISRLVCLWRFHQAKGDVYDYRTVFDTAKCVDT